MTFGSSSSFLSKEISIMPFLPKQRRNWWTQVFPTFLFHESKISRREQSKEKRWTFYSNLVSCMKRGFIATTIRYGAHRKKPFISEFTHAGMLRHSVLLYLFSSSVLLDPSFFYSNALKERNSQSTKNIVYLLQ